MASRGLPALAPFVRPLRSPWPWVGLGVVLLLTLGPWLLLRRAEKVRLEMAQASQADTVVRQLERRMRNLEQVLRGAAGYLGRGAQPTREEWQTYVKHLDYGATYPGLQSLSFVEWIPNESLAAHVQRVRSEGFPDYTVVPGGSLAPLSGGFSSIVYLEPMDERNQRAFSKDMLADASRKEAMLRARDMGQVVLTGKVRLYQETEAGIQAGTVLFAPVFRQGLPRETVADRRRALRGWVSIPLRMTDFLQATLPRDTGLADVEVYDGAEAAPEHLLFDSDPARPRSGAALRQDRPLTIAGRTWLARIEPSPAFFAAMGQTHHWGVLIAGLMASFLLFSLLLTYQGAEGRAQQLARRRGEEMLTTAAQFQALFERAPLGMAIADTATGRYLSVNPRLGQILGYAPEELLGHTFADVTHPGHVQMDLASLRDLATGRISEYQKEKRYLHRDGHEVWARLSVALLPTAPAEPRRHLALVEDITDLRRAMEAVRTSEERFHNLFELSPDPITLSRLSDGIPVVVNRAWCELTGFNMQEDLEPPHADLAAWAHQAEHEALLEELRKSGSLFQREATFLGRNGAGYRLLFTAKVIVMEGEPCALIIGKNVTERHAAELALQESEARWQFALDGAGDGVWDWQGDSDTMFLSRGYRSMLGYEAAEPLGTTYVDWIERIHPEDREAVEAAASAYLAGTTPAYKAEYRIRRKDGSYLSVLARGMAVDWDAGGRPKRMIGTHTDITEHKKMESDLRSTENLFRLISSGLRDYILILDLDGTISYINLVPAGIKIAQATGAHFTLGLDPEARAIADAAFLDCLRTGRETTYSAPGTRLDGSTGWFEVRLEPVREVEAIIAVIALAFDRTDARKTETSLQASEIRTRKAESLVLMAGGIAHDFNNLFQAIQGNLEIAGLRARGDHGLVQPLQRAMEVLNRAISLSWKMLDFSGHFIVKLENLDLEHWLPAYLATVRLEFPETFTLDLSCEPVPVIRGDRLKLEQAVKALLENALEAAPTQTGRVRLRLFVDFGEDRPGPDSPGIWPLRRPELPATICLELADDGPGVPSGKLDVICDPFYTSREPGRGLGLPVAVGILSAHRAGFHIFNGAGEGLVLRIHVPPSGA